jgi:hypothetical protein
MSNRLISSPHNQQPQPSASGTGVDSSGNKRTFTHLLIGPPRGIRDPHVFHRLSLVAFLAWVGLGSDG